MLHITPVVAEQHPGTLFGLMAVDGLDTTPDKNAWAALKQAEIAALRTAWPMYNRKEALLTDPLRCYAGYYKAFKKTYPVLLQLESLLLKGRGVDAGCLAVETMFLAEVKHCLLVAGHDRARLSGPFTLDAAGGGESFTAMGEQQRALKPGDVFMAGGGAILSSILEGQDFYSRLTGKSAAALYCVYCVGGVTPERLQLFFQDLRRYTLAAFPGALVAAGEVHQALPAL